MEELLKAYDERKPEITRRLSEFRALQHAPEEKLFAELAFCLLTPQSKARICDKAVSSLEHSGALLSGSPTEILKHLTGVRFPANKARYIAGARKLFTNTRGLEIKNRITGNPTEAREWLVKNVKGLGYKEASHFLRNVGLGENLAILDRHILKNLLRFGAIPEIPKTLTKKTYMEIEEEMKKFAGKIGIPLAELDLLLWSMETGEVFK